MSSINLTTLRKKIFTSIKEVVDYNDPLIINRSGGNAVIISEEDYNSLLETVYLCSIPELSKKIKECEKEDVKKMKTYKPGEKW